MYVELPEGVDLNKLTFEEMVALGEKIGVKLQGNAWTHQKLRDLMRALFGV